jgi:hypothetical protein
MVIKPPCRLIYQLIPGCSFIVETGACKVSRVVAPGGCGPVSLIASPEIKPFLQNKVLVALDPTVLSKLDPGSYTKLEPQYIEPALEEETAVQEAVTKDTSHFTQLTSTQEPTSYGPKWEDLFDKGNERGY